jgi:hypothetical protein
MVVFLLGISVDQCKLIDGRDDILRFTVYVYEDSSLFIEEAEARFYKRGITNQVHDNPALSLVS